MKPSGNLPQGADPELKPVVDEMEKTGNVHRAYRKVKRRQAVKTVVDGTTQVGERTYDAGSSFET